MSISNQDKYERLINYLETFVYDKTLNTIKKIFEETQDLNEVLAFIYNSIRARPERGEERVGTKGKSFETEIKEIEIIIKDCWTV